MRPTALVRIPLQVGVGSVRDLALGTLLAVPGLYAMLGAAPIGDALAPTERGMFSTHVDPVFAVGFMTAASLLGAAAVLSGLRLLARAIARRPSDLVVTSEGVTFLGGRYAGFSLVWRDLQGARWEVTHRRGTWTLRDGPDEDAFEIAHTSSEEEADTFDETTDAMQAIFKAKSSATHARAFVPGIFECTGCGAPLRPTEADAVTCGHCGSRTVVPTEARDRLRTLDERRDRDRETDRAVALCLRQPSASAAGAMLGSGGAGMLVVSTLWGVYMWRAFFGKGLHVGAVAASMTLVLAVVLGVLALALSVVGSRRSLHVVTLAMGAVAPSGDHGVWACRRCGGPLGHAEGVSILACEHCGAPNIVGVDLVGLTAKARDLILDDALHMRARRRTRAALLAAAGVGLLLVASFAWWRG